MMRFDEKIKDVQKELVQKNIDGWLLYDFRRSNPLAHAFLGISKEKMVSRRFFYWIPQQGEAIKIVSAIEPFTLDSLPGVKWIYQGWEQLEQFLFSIVAEHRKIAMEYSPNNGLPTISKVDAGTVELLRRCGAEVVSSGDLLQRYTSVWSKAQVESHFAAANVLDEIVEKTWTFIENLVRRDVSINEFKVQQFMLKKMEEMGCETDHAPTCAVNAHSADPHYHPTSDSAWPIKKGDFILLDLWCKKKVPCSVYADITRVGVIAESPSDRQQEIFSVVKGARDAATAFIKHRYEKKIPIQGWEVDRLCRNFIQDAGYGEYFIHRTGHNIGEEVHGAGANLDDYETHDCRTLFSGSAFSVEPGIYLPGEFGVRLEYDIYLDPAGVMCITGGVQKELMLMHF